MSFKTTGTCTQCGGEAEIVYKHEPITERVLEVLNAVRLHYEQHNPTIRDPNLTHSTAYCYHCIVCDAWREYING